MLDIKFIRENLELVKTNNENRRVKVDLDKLLELDEQRRNLKHQIDEARAKLKKGSRGGKPSDEEITQMRKLGDEIKELEANFSQIEEEYLDLLHKVPNLTHPEVPLGGEENFKVLETVGKQPKFDFAPKTHEELGKELDLIDFERGAKVAASKFYFYKNDMVRLSQALINYGIDVVTKHGYTLLETPDIAKNEILSGMGYQPRGPETQIYSIADTDMSLIGTAEITVGGYHADEVLDLEEGPKKYVALSHCFRTEAGAYGRESHGLYRVHQFTKLEMFIFCKPEDSDAMHQELLDIEKEICDGLGFSYRVIDTASADLGAPAYRKFDIEAWMTMKTDYGEITSTSNCTDYQARNLNIRYRKKDGSPGFVHTLNGTAVALSRFPLVVLENFQNADGSIQVPKVLQKYMSIDRITRSK